MVAGEDSGRNRGQNPPRRYPSAALRAGSDTEKTPSMPEDHRPRGFIPIGVFFCFGAIMAAYAAVTLLKPGTFLDALWVLNRTGHERLAALGRIAGLPFVILSLSLCSAASGWFLRRQWGWVLGVTIIAVNMAGDLGQLVFGERMKGIVGVAIASLLLIYMTQAKVRNYFHTK